MKQREPLYECMECGKKFYSVRSAQTAAYDGCLKCGEVDVDTYVRIVQTTTPSQDQRSTSYTSWTR